MTIRWSPASVTGVVFSPQGEATATFSLEMYSAVVLSVRSSQPMKLCPNTTERNNNTCNYAETWLNAETIALFASLCA